jgi:hypothetical protein
MPLPSDCMIMKGIIPLLHFEENQFPKIKH